MSLGVLGASLESPCGPWNDPGASLERPLSDPGREMTIEILVFQWFSNPYFSLLFRPWGVRGGPWSDCGASLDRPWCPLEFFESKKTAPASSGELPEAPPSSWGKRSSAGAAAAREYEGDPQLHAV